MVVVHVKSFTVQGFLYRFFFFVTMPPVLCLAAYQVPVQRKQHLPGSAQWPGSGSGGRVKMVQITVIKHGKWGRTDGETQREIIWGDKTVAHQHGLFFSPS